MKKIIALIFSAAASFAQAQTPSTFSTDVDPATVECGIFLNALQEVRIPAVTVPVSPVAPTGRKCIYSLTGKPDGNYAGQMTARSAPDSFGRTGVSAKSVVLNFVLPVPAGPTAPGVPQNPKHSLD